MYYKYIFVEASIVAHRITFIKQHLGQPRPTWAYATQVTLTSVMGHPNSYLGLKICFTTCILNTTLNYTTYVLFCAKILCRFGY